MGDLLNAIVEVFNYNIILWIVFGAIIGTVFGAIPGLTATVAIALFVPLTFTLDFTQSMAFLLGIYTTGFWAGSIPAILLNTPGAPGNAATTLEGYPMARKGMAGKALQYAVISSVIGGLVSAVSLFFLAKYISLIALNIASPEYFMLGMLALVAVGSVSGGNLLKGLLAGIIGLLISTIGIDPLVGIPRFTFNNLNLLSGINIIPALVGFFAVTEALIRLEELGEGNFKTTPLSKLDNIFKHMTEYVKHKWLLLKSIFIGVFIGALPGTGPGIASWIAYNEAKRSSKSPEDFGKGTAEGIIATESSNNAVTGGALVPLLTLGIPGDSVTAVLLGALMIQGIAPGPDFVVQNSDLIAIILLILIISNILMLFIGVAGMRYFPRLLNIPMQLLMPILLVVMVAGGFATNNTVYDVKVLIILGLIGYFIVKFRFPIPPIVIGLVIGPIVEINFRRSLIASDMDFTIFFTRPISLTILIVTIVLAVLLTKGTKQQTS